MSHGTYITTYKVILHLFQMTTCIKCRGTVYLQERILRLLLAHWDIVFLPLDIASTDQTSDIKTLGPAEGPCCREEARVRDNFLVRLGFILDALSAELEACVGTISRMPSLYCTPPDQISSVTRRPE